MEHGSQWRNDSDSTRRSGSSSSDSRPALPEPRVAHPAASDPGTWPAGVQWVSIGPHLIRAARRNHGSLIPRPRCLPAVALALVWISTVLAAPPSPTRVEELATWLPAHPTGVGRPISDRPAWTTLAEKPQWRDLIREAESLARSGLPEQPDELYLDFSRTGNRDRWQRVAFARRGRVATFTMAEALENRGRFLPPLEETLNALCAERTWVYPAHDRSLRNFRGEIVEMDLGSTALSWDMATALWLLGDKLSPETRARVRDNLERRTLRPFRAMIEGRQPEAFWLRATHNWNAVCLAGTVGTALAVVESPRDRAWFVAAAEDHIRFFLRGFTPDGYCSEGLGYWNYGFGHFTWLGEMLRLATGGRLDLLALPQARMPALFPWRAEILNGVYPSISDCSPGTRPDARVVQVLAQRLHLPLPGGVQAGEPEPGRALAISVLSAFLPRPLPALSTQPDAFQPDPLRTWFENAGVLICRSPEGQPPFAACLKGGHNAEHHNHNDVGSFSVVVGSTMVLCDPGAEVYTARTFSSRRYESRVLNSYGHSVPVVDGQLQQTGASARAQVVEVSLGPEEDRLVFDLTRAYKVEGLTRLLRTFVFRRGPHPALTVTDSWQATRPVTFESALITWSPWSWTAHQLRVGNEHAAVRVTLNTHGADSSVSDEILEEDVRTREKPRRLAVRLHQPTRAGRLAMTIEPLSR